MRANGPILIAVLSFALLSAACSSPAAAPETEASPAESASESPPGTIPSAEAVKYIGEKGTVCGTVSNTRVGSDTLGEEKSIRLSRGGEAKLDFDQPFPNQSFNVTIMQHHKKNFPVDLQDHYNGKEICVSGYIDSFFDGMPFIRVEKPDDIEAVP